MKEKGIDFLYDSFFAAGLPDISGSGKLDALNDIKPNNGDPIICDYDGTVSSKNSNTSDILLKC